MNEREEKIIKLMKEWKDEIKDTISNYEKGIQRLDKAKTTFEQSKIGFLQKYQLILYPATLLLFIVLLLLSLKYIGSWCKITMPNLQITLEKACEK